MNETAAAHHARELAEDDEEFGITIERPIEGLKIKSHRARMRAWRKLARRLYAAEPAAFTKGKERWNGLVTYDAWKDRICWNGHGLPGTRCWKSNSLPGEHLGRTVLVMIFKNEAAIMERMLKSVVDTMDGFICLDTGSTDQSREIFWDFLVHKHGKRGALFESPWYDFGTNRSIVAQLAHGSGDWLMLYDADYVMEYRDERGEPAPSGFDWRSKLPPMTNAPPMLLLGCLGPLAYSRPHIVRGDMRMCYHNRTHEFLAVSNHDKSGVPHRQEAFPYVMISHIGDGGSKADKCPRDLVLLFMDAMDDPNAERSYFYAANSARQMGMPHAARYFHKMHLKRCFWNEEQLCSSKGMLETMWATKESDARQLAITLHASFQNPERLEMLSQYLRYLRSTPSMWPAWAHVAACVGSLFTHNSYPAQQKLFLEVWELKFGFFHELSIACFYSPTYFELGLYISRRIVQDGEFKNQSKPVQELTLANRRLFEMRLSECVAKGVRSTPAIRKHLMDRAHRQFAQARYAKARDLYAAAVHPIVNREAITDLSLLPPSPTDMANEGELLNTVAYHKAHRLSAWMNGRPLHHAVTEADQDRALCCYQMGRCDERTTHNTGSAEGKLLVAMHFLDALKFCPMYPPAMSALMEMTHLATPDVTRCLLYLVRAVTVGEAQHASAAVLRPVKAALDAAAVDQSAWCRTDTTLLPGTAILRPRPPPQSVAEPSPTPHPPSPAWLALVTPSILFPRA